MVIASIINFGRWSFIYYLDFISGSIEIELISFLVCCFEMIKKKSEPTIIVKLCW